MRRLVVLAIEPITTRMARVTLGGPELEGFVSMAPDDHVKVLFPPSPGVEPVLPRVESGRVVWPLEGPRPVARDYTPARFDRDSGELDIELVLHRHGHASAWIGWSKPGDALAVAGPRGSHVLKPPPEDLLLAGDETALPAIARWFRELTASARVHALIEVQDALAERTLSTAAEARVQWLYRGNAEPGTTTLLLDAIRRASISPRLSHVWLAGEANAVQAMRRHLCEKRYIPAKSVSARGYWKRGTKDHQEPHED